tara:strand:- start:5867 stop:6451 length:585 start_codon:yes stop_codon:yes gene_type:complete
MGDLVLLSNGERSIDSAVKRLHPLTDYRESRYRECIASVYRSNICPYDDPAFDWCKQLIAQETNLLVSNYLDLLSNASSFSVLDDIDFHVSLVGFVTTCLEKLENFSSAIRKGNQWVDYVTGADPLDIIYRDSQRLQFLEWFTGFYKKSLAANPGLTKKVITSVSSQLNNNSDLFIPAEELQNIISLSSGFFQD